VVAGGGTGGHIFPALSIANRLERIGVKTIYMGSSSGLERRIVIRKCMYLLPVIGWVDKNLFGKMEFIIRFIPSLIISIYILLKFKPSAIILTGGFVSVPIGISGILCKVPIFTLILDWPVGLAARLFSNYSEEVFLPYEGNFSTVSNLNKTVTGIPLRKDIFCADKEVALRYFKLDKNKKTLLIIGGSRGARRLVKLVEELIPEMDSQYWQFIIQKGKHKLKYSGDNIREFNFIERVDLAYAVADFIISRSGAMVTAEIEQTGIPTILIPYPYAYKDHQFHNAQRLSEKCSNIKVVREEEINVNKILKIIEELKDEKIAIKKEDAAEKIIKRMEHYVWKN
jgi:UDP-N-acetylglucosamine--N-acetylmuramyl-(pentapeptide) pyrophosphoryl-undecaprenol N-acetylglucosamine transferase